MNATASETENKKPESCEIRVAYSPDSDDAFNFYAWEHNRVTCPGVSATFIRDHIIALNHLAANGEAEVVGISSAFYPLVADRYWILTVGSSIGRGYGPVLASRNYETTRELFGRRVGVGGMPTTGGALALMYCPGATLVEMRYDRIADAIAAGEIDAGVMIHEELLYFPQKGLRRVADLGAQWCEDTGLPLPVGLNVVSKSVGRDIAGGIARTCDESLRWAHEHFDEAFAFARKFGRGCAEQHIAMFSNEDTAHLSADVRAALPIMFDRCASLGLGPAVKCIEIIDD